MDRWRSPLAWVRTAWPDIAQVRAEATVFGLVACDPTVWRTIDALSEDASAALRVFHGARAVARERVWGWSAGTPRTWDRRRPPDRDRRGGNAGNRAQCGELIDIWGLNIMTSP